MGRSNGRTRAPAVQLPASLQAMVEGAREMFLVIDQQKARCFVQQMTNGHSDDEVFSRDPDKTYAQRRAELQDAEERLRDSLPPAVLDAIEELASA